MGVKKYQPERQDIFWNTSWGIPKSEMSQAVAKERGLNLFKGRWVTPQEDVLLRKQWLGYSSIRDVGWMMILAALWRGMGLLNMAQYFRDPSNFYLPEFLAKVIGLPQGAVVVLLWILAQVVFAVGLIKLTPWGYRGALVMVILSAFSAVFPLLFLVFTGPVGLEQRVIAERMVDAVYLCFWIAALYILAKRYSRDVCLGPPVADGILRSQAQVPVKPVS